MSLVIQQPNHWPITLQNATPTSDGVMSAADKAKLDSLTPGGGSNPTVLPFTAGAFTPTLTLGDVSNGVWLQIVADDPDAYADFFGTWLSSPNAVGPNDDVVNLGFNLNEGGGQVDVDKGAVGFSIESTFIAGHPQQELHGVWWPPNTAPGWAQTRFFSFEGHDDDGSSTLFIDAITIAISSGRNSSALPSLVVNPTDTFILSPNQNAFGLFDNTGDGTIKLIISDGVDTTAQLVMNGGQCDIVTSLVGRLTDARNSGLPSFQWDATQVQMLSANNQTQVQVVDSQIYLTVDAVPTLICQPTQVFIPNRRLYLQKDAIGTDTSAAIMTLQMRNTTDATALTTRQFSPSIVQTSYGWTGAVSRAVSFSTQGQPDGAGAGSLVWSYSSDEANYTQIAALNSAGGLSLVAGIGLWGVATPATQFAPAHSTAGFTQNAGTPVLAGSTSTGNVGAVAMTLDDIVACLKYHGFVSSA